MSRELLPIATALMHGLVMKTGGFGTEGDVVRAFDVAELMYAEALKREPKIREMEAKADEVRRASRSG